MSNDGKDKQERPERQPERQTDYEKRAQGEVNANLNDYTEKVIAIRLEKKLSGTSCVTGQLADQNGKGLASAKDLLGDDAHGLSKKEKNAALLARMEKDGNIVGESKEKPIEIAQNFEIPNPVEAYKREFEHRYRGRELETMDREIPAKAWNEAYKAFPELKRFGEKDSIKLLKAIIANELEHYGQEDLAQDAIAGLGQGGTLHRQSLGFAQITPNGVHEIAEQMESQLISKQRSENPLFKFRKLSNDEIAKELVNPANAPFFAAAHVAMDLRMLNRHKGELKVTLEALGYQYNADRVYAVTDPKHEHLLNKKEADRKHIPRVIALPTDSVLKHSEHAQNIRKWLEKIH